MCTLFISLPDRPQYVSLPWRPLYAHSPWSAFPIGRCAQLEVQRPNDSGACAVTIIRAFDPDRIKPLVNFHSASLLICTFTVPSRRSSQHYYRESILIIGDYIRDGLHLLFPAHLHTEYPVNFATHQVLLLNSTYCPPK